MEAAPELEAKTTRDLNLVVARLRLLSGGLVLIDGCQGAGKTHLMLEIAKRICCVCIDLDDFLTKNQGSFVTCLRLGELDDRISASERTANIVAIAGVCGFEVLDRLGRSAVLSIYVQRNTPQDIPGDLEILDAEEDDPFGIGKDLVKLGLEGGQLHREVRAYHERFKPRKRSDLIFVRTEQ